MKKIFIILSLVTITLVTFAGPVQELMELAESAFSKGDFDKAKSYYVDIVNLQSATDKQRDDARYNINICQTHINDAQYNSRYNHALSLFKGKSFTQSRSICVGLLKYGKYKSKTNKLIQLCNDSITARNLAQQKINDEVELQRVLQAEYDLIVSEALSYFQNRRYLEAINTYNKVIDRKFANLGSQEPEWVGQCKDMLLHMLEGKAITQEFAGIISNAISIGDFNSGLVRIVTRHKDASIINSDSTLYISSLGHKALSFKGQEYSNFKEGYLVNDLDFANGGYFDTSGNYITAKTISIRNYDGLLKKGWIYQLKEFSNGMAPFKNENNKWGYINNNFNVVIAPTYDFVSAFQEGVAFVRKGSKWSIIDKNGKNILSNLYPAFQGSAFDKPQNGYYPRINWSYCKDGRIWVQTSKYKNILVDKAGQTILDDKSYESQYILHHGKPLYSYEVFSEGLILYKDVYGNFGKYDMYGFMDEKGDIAITPRYELAYGFNAGLASVRNNGLWGYIDTHGNEIIPPSFEDISHNGFHDELCPASINKKWGFINKSGKWIIEPIYDWARDFSEGFAAVSLNGQLGFVDKFGNSTFDYQ
ncbi:MAG: WG repeat-containing protein [Muribaculum sp.]|nr:WG repeat-containing protein [Muribaculum sp.]